MKHSLSQRESDEFVPACFQEMLDVFLSDGAAEEQTQGEGWTYSTLQPALLRKDSVGLARALELSRIDF